MMDKAYERGGIVATAGGFLGGAIVYTSANWWLSRKGAKHRKRSSDSPAIIAATTAVAAGAILTMLVDTMIPEAFEGSHTFAGLITVLGFLAAFALSKLAGE
jgi:ZIP family zinc transporter